MNKTLYNQFIVLLTSRLLQTNRLSGHLVSGHFEFQIVSGQIGLVIGLSSVRLYKVLNYIGLDWIKSD
jgi:hypothetical protein